MTVALEDRIAELEARSLRFKLATTGMEGWENYFQSLVMQERDYIVDLMTEVVAQLHREIRDEMKALITEALTQRIRGTFDPKAKYNLGDVVAHDGASFIARRNDPGPLPGSGWQLLARQGSRGVAGPKGEPGRSITSWKVDRQHFLVIPIMSDGREGPALELRALFEDTPA
jgi:hypothetical protein